MESENAKLRYHDDEEGNALAAAFVRGEIPDNYCDQLLSPENIGGLSDALSALNQDIEAQFSERKARAQEFHNECMARGYDGKREWFEHKSEYDKWRAGAQRFKNSVVGAKRKVDRRRRELAATGTFSPQSDMGVNKRLRGEMHALRRTLAVVLERYGPYDSYMVEDWETGGADAPFVRLERTEDDDGWLVTIERRQEGE